MTERFISQRLTPVMNNLASQAMVSGEPGLPKAFTWGNESLEITHVLNRWKESGPCRHGGGEQYIRKHWFEVETGQGKRLKIYFERQARSSSQRKQRWWLYSMDENPPKASR